MVGEESAEPMSKIRLRNLVYDWIQNDKVLKQHITLSFFDDGFYIETVCGGKFTIAWIYEDGKYGEVGAFSTVVSPNVWDNEGRAFNFNPADPNYFDNLEKACRRWHNSYSTYTYGCKDKL